VVVDQPRFPISDEDGLEYSVTPQRCQIVREQQRSVRVSHPALAVHHDHIPHRRLAACLRILLDP
jgi:hypothetical protein